MKSINFKKIGEMALTAAFGFVVFCVFFLLLGAVGFWLRGGV